MNVSLNTNHALLFVRPVNRWLEEPTKSLTPAELLLYRSNLLGSDLTVTNFGGGNTSAKLQGKDPLTGKSTTVLWVKGSGGDIGSMTAEGFATLYMDKLLALEGLYRGPALEDEIVSYLPHCTFGLNPRPASIDTPLHALLPYAHVDHVHPDAITAIAACSAGEQVTAELYQGAVGWLPWRRPGFELALQLRDYVEARPGLRGVILAGHGLICWGDSSRSCYDNTIELIAQAADYLNKRLVKGPAFGGQIVAIAPPEKRRAIAAALMPRLRALMAGGRGKIGHFGDDPEALEFVCSKDFPRLAAIGTSCPDHFLRTKIAPLALDPDRISDDKYLEGELEVYRKGHAAYYARNASPESPKMRDPNPVVVLIPGVGRLTFAGDKTTARLAGEFYSNAINVMRGAEAIGSYVGLPEKDAFSIEYWVLEEAKLQRMPKPKALVGKIALITGGAGGIGAAIASRLLREGACVVLLDRDSRALKESYDNFVEQYGRDTVAATECDVTDEDQVTQAFASAMCAFGGLDIFVANAGLASSASLEDTSVALWVSNYSVLAMGYFLTTRAAFSRMKRTGGSIVFVGSKNAVAATPNASAYASAKAASLHFGRCVALEGAPYGIRVNTVNPDAVIQGSRIWAGEWRQERAAAHGIDAGHELEEHYRQRSLLKRSVFPEDVAEAVFFFASDISAKSTGNVVNVDAGNAQAFMR